MIHRDKDGKFVYAIVDGKRLNQRQLAEKIGLTPRSLRRRLDSGKTLADLLPKDRIVRDNVGRFKYAIIGGSRRSQADLAAMIGMSTRTVRDRLGSGIDLADLLKGKPKKVAAKVTRRGRSTDHLAPFSERPAMSRSEEGKRREEIRQKLNIKLEDISLKHELEADLW